MFIRGTRVIDWNLHLAAFRAMIPWFFACDRTNYARYGSAYWLEMTALDQTHPGSLYTGWLFSCSYFSCLSVYTFLIDNYIVFHPVHYFE